MPLRSGKNYQKSSFKKKTKPEPDKMATPPSVVTVINAQSALVPFQGIVNGKLTQGLENWICAIDDHLRAKTIVDPVLQLQEAKAYLDHTKGDVAAWVCTESYKECKSWDELKSLFRGIYGTAAEVDEVTMLRNVFKLTQTQELSVLDYIALLNNKVDEWYAKFSQSSWIQIGACQLGDLRRFVKLTLIMAVLPDRLVRLFDTKLDRESREITIINLVKKHRSACTDLNPILFSCFEQARIPSTTNTSDPTPQSVNVVTSNSLTNVTCYNCNKPGHLKQDCRTKYCSIHKTSTHGYKYCKSRLRNSTGTNTPNTGKPNTPSPSGPNPNHRTGANQRKSNQYPRKYNNRGYQKRNTNPSQPQYANPPQQPPSNVPQMQYSNPPQSFNNNNAPNIIQMPMNPPTNPQNFQTPPERTRVT